MNRLWRGVFAGSLLGLAAVGTMAVTGYRRRMRLLREEEMRRERVRRVLRSVKDNVFRFGAALKSGAEAFAGRWSQKRSWGRT
ncbi:MAG: hypothetical protein GX493_05125 [Firmicutes bacterium]|nr:hypothetical protein [Bacillota bacterium]